MSLPQTNCTLTRVEAVSAVGETYDGPADAGSVKWSAPTGQGPNGYVRIRKRRVAPEGGAVVEVGRDRELIVQTDDPPITWRVGDIVTFTGLDGVVQNAHVDEVNQAQIDDVAIPRDLVTTTLRLSPR